MITLLTDFGTTDYFVPAVKGVILSLCPTANIIDLMHDIPAQDVASAAFTLGACYQNFPAGTIHLTVVDPGVGSARRALVVEAGEHYFVGPDNGIFSFVYAREGNWRAFQITRGEFLRPRVSPTFHGRDVFAPVAAWLAKGVAPESFGAEISDVVRLSLSPPEPTETGWRGAVIHVDHFGNCITNLTAREWTLQDCTANTRLLIAGQIVSQFGTHFAQSAKANELFAYLGSAGYWEIALWQDSAANRLQVQRGTVVQLLRGEAG
jgi:hypothetical protein